MSEQFCTSCMQHRPCSCDQIEAAPPVPIKVTTGPEVEFDELLFDHIFPVLRDAIVGMEAKHGRLTTDRTRAFTILAAEVGEVAMAVLGTTGSSRPKTDDDLSLELIQVAATAISMLIPLMAYRLPDRRDS